MDKYQENLIQAYDRGANERDKAEVPVWKEEICHKFLSIIRAENKTSLIDIGAGTGVHGKYFQDEGVDVTCVDLSPAHVEKCREKGLRSIELDILHLDLFSEKFDCAFALSSLLHIPSADLPLALANIAKLLDSGGLMLWAQYGGEDREGIYEEDHYLPKRFFNLLDDRTMIQFAAREFQIENLERLHDVQLDPLHFQSLLLRAK